MHKDFKDSNPMLHEMKLIFLSVWTVLNFYLFIAYSIKSQSCFDFNFLKSFYVDNEKLKLHDRIL